MKIYVMFILKKDSIIENLSKQEINEDSSFNANKPKETIIELSKKIIELKKISSRDPFYLLEGEKIMSLIFISSDENIHKSII